MRDTAHRWGFFRERLPAGTPRGVPPGTDLTVHAPSGYGVDCRVFEFGGASAHPGRGCLGHQDCLACRWSADSVVVLAAPPALPGPERTAMVAPAADEATAESPSVPPSSRAPPLA